MASRPIEVIRFIGRSSKRIAVSVVGGVLVVAGLAMLVLPGPGLIVIVLGFAVLGTEYAWAAAALERTKKAAAQAGDIAKNGVRQVGNAAGKVGGAAVDGVGKAGGAAVRGVGRAGGAVRDGADRTIRGTRTARRRPDGP